MTSEVEFTFNGRQVRARPEQSVAAALYEQGIRVLSVSHVYQRPRGMFCAASRCPSCSLIVDGQPTTRSCATMPTPGMEVRTDLTQAQARVMRGLDYFISPFFPLGFQYRLFKRSRVMFRTWERILRRTASHTPLPTAGEVRPSKTVVVDVAVVGAGPAGISAAVECAGRGLRVALLNRSGRPGGLAKGSPAIRSLLDELTRHEHAGLVQRYDRVMAVARFGDRLIVDHQGAGVVFVTPHVVVATGAYEQAPVFEGNDRPGVLLTSGAYRLLTEQDTRLLGPTVAAVTTDRSMAIVASLVEAGTDIRAVIDLRPPSARPLPLGGVDVLTGYKLHKTVGRAELRGVVLRDERSGRKFRLPCANLIVGGEWQPADELLVSATSRGLVVVEYERASDAMWRGAVESGSSMELPAGSLVGAETPELAVLHGKVVATIIAAELGRAGGDELDKILDSVQVSG